MSIVDGGGHSVRLRRECTPLGDVVGAWDPGVARRQAVVRGADTVQKVLLSTYRRAENSVGTERTRWSIAFWRCGAAGGPR